MLTLASHLRGQLQATDNRHAFVAHGCYISISQIVDSRTRESAGSRRGWHKRPLEGTFFPYTHWHTHDMPGSASFSPPFLRYTDNRTHTHTEASSAIIIRVTRDPLPLLLLLPPLTFPDVHDSLFFPDPIIRLSCSPLSVSSFPAVSYRSEIYSQTLRDHKNI